jgi:hypothetical protein
MSDGRLGTLDVTTGVASGIASPITLPYLVAAASGVASGSASGVAIAGISTATLASGTGYLAASPVSPTSVAAATSPSANALILLTGSDPDWAITGALTGFTSPGQIAWATTGSQFLASQPAANAVAVISVVGSGLSIAQTLSLTDPTQIAVTEDGTEALVVQPSAGTVTVLANSSGTWSIGSGVAVPGAVSVVMTGESSAAVAATAGVVFLARSGATWGIQSTVALSFSPTRVTADADGTVYVVGTAGSHGFLNVISGGSIIGTMEWTGTGDDVLVDQTKIIILNNLEYQILFASIIGSGSGAVFFSEPQSQVSRSGATSLAMTGSETIWLCGSDTLLGELAHPGGGIGFIQSVVGHAQAQDDHVVVGGGDIVAIIIEKNAGRQHGAAFVAIMKSVGLTYMEHICRRHRRDVPMQVVPPKHSLRHHYRRLQQPTISDSGKSTMAAQRVIVNRLHLADCQKANGMFCHLASSAKARA